MARSYNMNTMPQSQGKYQFYDASDLARLTETPAPTVCSWADEGLIVPCKGSPATWRIFNESEKDRIIEAKRLAGGSPRQIYKYLLRTLHEASPGQVFSPDDIVQETSRYRWTVVRTMKKCGAFAKRSSGIVLPIECKERVLDMLAGKPHQTRAPKKSMAATVDKIKISLKGMTIELSKEDAMKLAEEIIDKI